MPLTHEPKPLPSELDYVPDNSLPIIPYAGLSFYFLAKSGLAKAAGMTAMDICFYNFKTRNPTVINWYLKNKIGCTKATKDGKNYMFSGNENGIIFLPLGGTYPEIGDEPEPAWVEWNRNRTD
jgi:hypothetical protein